MQEMKQMESQIQLERMQQQNEFIKRQQEYKATNDLISNEFPEAPSHNHALGNREDDIELRDSKILNSFNARTKRERRKIKNNCSRECR